MRAANCAECARLLNESASLRWQYNAARDALALTDSLDHSYGDRSMDLASVSDRLDAAERLQHVHEESHGLDLLVRRRPERRVSLVADRRRSFRGGRRGTDAGWSSPPSFLTCAGCQTGTAGLLELEFSTMGAVSKAMYRCRDCGHQFNQIAEP
jgi:hypothetical protein